MSLDAVWGRCAGWLAQALAHGGDTHSLEDVRAMVRVGEAELWAGARSAVVTILEDDPRERRLLIWLAGGELAELRGELLPRIEQRARSLGCRRLLIIGRAGWERALKPNGYAPLARVIAKEL